MIRKATASDLSQIMICINDAKKLLKDSGSIQWNGPDNYPNEDTILSDIKQGIAYVEELNSDIAGIAVFAGYEDEYEDPKYGKWLTNTNNYLTVHRVAVSSKYRGTGVGKRLLNYSFEFAKENNLKSVRIDTHPKNVIMQGLVEALGFSKCGMMIYKRIAVEPERLIYEKII